MLGARIHGSELGAEIHGSEVGAIDLQPVWLADSYRCWFVYVREKYCWLVQMNSVFVRGLASPASQPALADHADSCFLCYY